MISIRKYKTCMFQLPSLNARQILNVQTTLHVYKKNAKIPVTQIPAVEMQSVKLKTTGQYVSAFTDM